MRKHETQREKRRKSVTRERIEECIAFSGVYENDKCVEDCTNIGERSCAEF